MSDSCVQVQQMFMDMGELRREHDRLEADLRRLTGEELPSGATKHELAKLEQKLEVTLSKVREMKVVTHKITAQNSVLNS